MTEGAYQVLARKWRPQKFDQVVGQAAIVRTLSNALEQGRVAHAYCFSGIRGVGKTTIARLVAKGLNCRRTETPTSQPCGECEACTEIEESRSLDVIELDAASQTGVDSIRQLNEVARYTPSRDRYRVFIIDEAHMLSASAFNALLKTLEEPPAHVVFMLATTEPHKILQTVLSRCQHYPLGRISQAELTGRLREIAEAEGVGISDDGIAMVALAADGSLRDAQSLLDKLIAFGGESIDDATVADLLGTVDRELLFSATDLIAARDLAGVLQLVNRMVEQGIDLHQFSLDMLGHLRGLLVVATVDDAGEILHLPDADLTRLRAQAGSFAVEDLDRAFALVAANEYRIKQSEVPRYHLEMVLSRLARMPVLEPIESLIRELRSEPGSASGTGGGGAGRGAPGRKRSVKARAATVAEAEPASVGARPPLVPAPSGLATDPPPLVADPPPLATDPPPLAAGPPPPAGSNGAAAAPRRQAVEEPAAPTRPATPRHGAEMSLILERLRADKPLVAQVVERVDGADFRDDTLFLTFAENNGIFGARLKDRSVLGAIEQAAAAALGRDVRVVAAVDETGMPAAPDAPVAAPVHGAETDRKRQELWKRAEAEPLVHEFVEALRGNLTDVEEI